MYCFKLNIKYLATSLVLMITCTLIHFVNNPFISKTMQTSDNFYNFPVLIIDSGHGGLDGGAIAENGYAESEATLEIGLKTKYLCDFLGIKNVLTRVDENSLDFDASKSIRENKVSDTRARVEIVNAIPNGILISVHLNKFSDENVFGAQVFYNSDGEDLARLLQENIQKNLDLDNNREILKAPETVYLISNSNNPAIIFECGFLSNKDEVLLLSDADYQTKLALMAVTSYVEYAMNENKKGV